MAKKPNNEPRDKHPLQAYAKYSGIAFQMIAIILLGAWGGKKLDTLLLMQKPVFTIILVILSTVFAIIHLFRSIQKK
jgi:ATP synthase protein I